jgi:hypothetical protein
METALLTLRTRKKNATKYLSVLRMSFGSKFEPNHFNRRVILIIILSPLDYLKLG